VYRFRAGRDEYALIVTDSHPAEGRTVRRNRLTPTERCIADLLVGGLGAQRIADRRGTSLHTVNNQIAAIYAKLGVHSRRELRYVYAADDAEVT
jgi:DNA-binding CsgD family transcriptional regulator